MGILHVTTTLASLNKPFEIRDIHICNAKHNIVTFNVIYNPIEVFKVNNYGVCVINWQNDIRSWYPIWSVKSSFTKIKVTKFVAFLKKLKCVRITKFAFFFPLERIHSFQIAVVYYLGSLWLSILCRPLWQTAILFFTRQWNLPKADTYGTKNFVHFREVLLFLTRNTERSHPKNRKPFRHTHNTLYSSPIVKETSLKTICPEEINVYWLLSFEQRLFTIFL